MEYLKAIIMGVGIGYTIYTISYVVIFIIKRILDKITYSTPVEPCNRFTDKKRFNRGSGYDSYKTIEGYDISAEDTIDDFIEKDEEKEKRRLYLIDEYRKTIKDFDDLRIIHYWLVALEDYMTKKAKINKLKLEEERSIAKSLTVKKPNHFAECGDVIVYTIDGLTYLEHKVIRRTLKWLGDIWEWEYFLGYDISSTYLGRNIMERRISLNQTTKKTNPNFKI